MISHRKIINKEFLYLRHGETDWNKERIAMGQKDIDLNQTGVTQATAAAEILKHYKKDIELIFCSPLMRTRKTAAIVADVLKVEVRENPKLMEINLGSYQGKSFLESDWLTAWEQGTIIEGAETPDAFSNRFLEGINECIDRQEKVLIVSHGLAFIQFSRLLMDEAVSLPNCSPIRCTPENGVFKIQQLK